MWLPIILPLSLTVAGIHFVAVTDVVYASIDGICPQQANELDRISKTSQETAKNQEDDSSGKCVRIAYPKSSITNDGDFKIRVQLDEADDMLEKKLHFPAREMYKSILRKHPQSPRAVAGLASAIHKLADKERSNMLLERSIAVYEQLLTLPDVPDQLMRTAGHKLAELQLFRGWTPDSMKTLQILAKKYPEDVKILGHLGNTYMLLEENKDAQDLFEKILKTHPDDGFAMVHLGYLYKMLEFNLSSAISLLKAGIDSQDEGTQEGEFYTYLGMALQQQGRMDEARDVHQRGKDLGFFPSLYQHSIYNVDVLTGRPWWTPQQTGYQEHLELLEEHWQVIRDEGLAELHAPHSMFKSTEERLTQTGDLKQLFLYIQGRKQETACARAPKTCEVIERIYPAKTCTRGQVKFSVIYPGTKVWRHSGPTNCRIRAHLGLLVDKGAKIQVVNETRTWTEGKVLILDDSFEHTVWHDGKSLRLILIVDFWHPELSVSMRRSLPPI